MRKIAIRIAHALRLYGPEDYWTLLLLIGGLVLLGGSVILTQHALLWFVHYVSPSTPYTQSPNPDGKLFLGTLLLSGFINFFFWMFVADTLFPRKQSSVR